ncbi:MAG: hypothetical protein KF860_01185 [Cyclobacteriaceae bacterium]|nr:hypothetical protein [Cyclobacteriaceae bacterium]
MSILWINVTSFPYLVEDRVSLELIKYLPDPGTGSKDEAEPLKESLYVVN